METMHSLLISILLLQYYLDTTSTTNYIDHVSCDGKVNFEMKPNDQLISLDGNTRLKMSNEGEWFLESRVNNSSSWVKVWSTYSYSDTITLGVPAFVVQADRNIVVYPGHGVCGSCHGWQADIHIPCCAIYHFFVHNGGYAYLLDEDYDFAGFTTDSSISPTTDPALYPASTLTSEPTSC